MSDSSLAGLASLLTMFERLQQPITFKLPHRGARRKGADQLEQADVVDAKVDQAPEANDPSGTETLDDARASAGAVSIGEGQEHRDGPTHDALAAPAPSSEPPEAHTLPTPELGSTAAYGDSAAAHEGTSAAAPRSDFALGSYGQLSAAGTTAMDREASPSPGASSAPHGDAATTGVDAAAPFLTPAPEVEARGSSALPAPVLLTPVALANADPLKQVPAAADEAGLEPETPADEATPAADATPQRSRSLRARRISVPRRSSAGSLVGLDIEPGQVVAVQAHVNGEVVVERAAGIPLAPDVIRDGEVNDPEALREALRALFAQSKLDRRVRIGIANQRIVMRRIELPPITDAKEIASAVRFQAADEIPMPLDSVVLDYHSLGIVDTAAGPRLHVVLVAARRDMVERVLDSARAAGLRPEGVDLAAFAMIRALRRGPRDSTEQVLYLSIGGITNLAIASGASCEFTRAIGTGIEQIIAEVASRCGIALGDARRLLAHVAEVDAATSLVVVQPRQLGIVEDSTTADHESTARIVLGDGVRRIAGEVRHSLDFHVSSGRGQGVARAVLCGPALDVPGFAAILGAELGMPVSAGTVALASPEVAEHVPASRLAVAAGLAVEEGPA